MNYRLTADMNYWLSANMNYLTSSNMNYSAAAEYESYRDGGAIRKYNIGSSSRNREGNVKDR